MKKIVIVLLFTLSFFLFEKTTVYALELENVSGDVIYTYSSAGQLVFNENGWVWGNRLSTINNKFVLRSPSSSTYYYIDSVEITLRIKPEQWKIGKKYAVSWFFTSSKNGIFNASDYSCIVLSGGANTDSTCSVSGGNNGLLANATIYAKDPASSDIFIRVISKYPTSGVQKWNNLLDVPQYDNLFYDVDIDIVGSINAGYFYDATSEAIININNQIKNEITDISSTLNDDTPPSSDISGLGNVQGLLKPGPVDSLLNIPVEFLSIFVSSLGGQCKPLSGTWVYDQPLTFPCFDEIIWNDLKDETLLNFVELIPCAFILIYYFKHLYKKVERATSMETNSDDEWGVI